MAARSRRKYGPRGNQNEEKSRLDRLSNLGLPNFYTTNVFNSTSKSNLDPRFLTKLIRVQEECRKYTPYIFDMLPQRKNLVCFLYHQRNEVSDMTAAREENRNILASYPNSLLALINKFYLCLSEKNLPEMDKVLETIEKIPPKEREKEEHIANAEIAFFYSHLDPTMYRKAIKLYREVLHIPENGAVDIADDKFVQLLDDKHQLIYKLELAMTYSKLMNQDNVRLSEEEVNGSYIQFCFQRIFDLLSQIIQDTEMYLDRKETATNDIKVIAGKAWVEYGNAYKKYETQLKKTEDRNLSLPQGMSIDDCYIKGVGICPNDIDILEKYAMHLQQRAQTEKNHLDAIKVFDDVLSINPNRHVSLHHKGLCYREAWYAACELPEAKLKNNPQRRGQNQRSKQKIDTFSDVASSFQSHNSGSHKHTYQGMKQGETNACQGKSKATSLSAPSTPSTDKQASIYKRSFSNLTSLPTIHPKRQLSHGQIPKHKQPGYFDQLKVSNPREDNVNKPHKYLIEAQICLETAIEASVHTSSRYLVDLARILVCLGRDDEALKYFEKASDPKNKYNNKDAAYLFEQWALLLDDISEKKDNVEHVKNLYRAAVKYAAKARERSRMAYYKLRDIIEWQLQEQGADNTALTKELALLHDAIEEVDKAKCTFLNLLEKDPENVWVMWDLIKTLQKAKNFTAAFEYVETVCEHLKRTNGMTSLTKEEKDLIFDVGLEQAFSAEQVVCKNTLQTLFHLLALTRSTSNTVFDQYAEEGNAIKCSDVMVMASDFDNPTVEMLKHVLQEICGLQTFILTTDDCSEDFPGGMSYSHVTEAALSQTKAVVIVSATLQSDFLMERLVNEVLCQKEIIKNVGLCLVMSEDEKEEQLPASIRTLVKVTLPTKLQPTTPVSMVEDLTVFVDNLLSQLLLDLSDDA